MKYWMIIMCAFSVFSAPGSIKAQVGDRVRWKANQPDAGWSWGTVVKAKVLANGDTICTVLFDSYGPDEKYMPAQMNAMSLTKEPVEDIRTLTQVMKCRHELERISEYGEEKKMGLFKNAVERLELRLRVMNTRLEEQLNPGIHQFIHDFKAQLEEAKRKYGLHGS